MSTPDLRAIPPQQAFDVAKLRDYLRARIEGIGDNLDVSQFKGGQSNPTYLLTSGARKFVLRRKPPGNLLPSAHAIDREFRLITALTNTDVPVARGHVLCEDDEIIGSAFYVMDYVEGRVLWDAALADVAMLERRAIYDEMNRIMAALHRVDYKAVGLSDYGREGQYVERQIARWSKQYRATETETIEAMNNLMVWLPQNMPAGDETSIIHGDFRIDNMIFAKDSARIIAVLDWELSTLGHPLADFAYHCLAWRMPHALFNGLADLDLGTLKIPSEREHLDQYCARTGRPPVTPRDWEFYIIFNLFRLVGIAQGVMARALQGNASSAQAHEMGARARPLAELAWKHVEVLERQATGGA